MRTTRLLGFSVVLVLILQGCGGSNIPAEIVDTPPPPPDTRQQLQGVFRWKGSDSGNALYTAGTLTPQSVNSTTFGQLARYHVGGIIQAQPLYVSNLDMGAAGVHNVVIVATEHAMTYSLSTPTAKWRNLSGHEATLDPALPPEQPYSPAGRVLARRSALPGLRSSIPSLARCTS